MLSSVNQYFVNKYEIYKPENCFWFFSFISLRPQNVTKQTINYFKTN